MTRPQWEMLVPVISTAHVPPSFDYISKRDHLAKVVTPLDCGWLLYVGDDQPEDWADVPGMPAVIEWFAEEYPDTDWLRLDPDGDVIPELPKHEWN